MEKKLIKKDEMEDLAEAKKFILDNLHPAGDPHELLKAVKSNIDKCYETNGETFEELEKVTRKALTVVGLDSHCHLAYFVEEKFQPLVIQFARDLAEEYKCNETSEKALVDVIAITYGRIVQYSDKLHRSSDPNFVNNISIGYCQIISKELDRANRHFITSMSLLKQIKNPVLPVKIQSKNAFVSNSQEFNQYSN